MASVAGESFDTLMKLAPSIEQTNQAFKKTTNLGALLLACSMRRPLEKAPEYLLILVIDSFGKVHLTRRTHSLSSSGVTASFANGHVALKSPSRAHKVILANPFMRSLRTLHPEEPLKYGPTGTGQNDEVRNDEGD